eukprot:Opistho-2@96665
MFKMGAVVRKPQARKELIFGDFLRIAIIGERGSGKTCVWLRFTKNQFAFKHEPTTYEEVAVVTQRCVTEDSTGDVAHQVAHLVTCEIWDTPPNDIATTESSRNVLKDVDAIIVVFDSTKSDGLDKAVQLKRDVQNALRKSSKSAQVWMLLATKTDLGGMHHTISELEMQRAVEEGSFWGSERVSSMAVSEINLALKSLMLHLIGVKTASSKPLSEQIAAAEAEAAALSAAFAANAAEATRTAAVANATIASMA